MVSLTILIISVYLISTALKNSYNQLIGTKNDKVMLNLAKQSLIEQKQRVLKEEITNTYKTDRHDNYEILNKIEKHDSFYKNYKIIVQIKDTDKEINKSMELVSYVTKH